MILAPGATRDSAPAREASDLAEERVRQSFENVNDRNYDARSKAVDPDVHHRLVGVYTMGGAARNGHAGAASASGRLNFRRRT